MKVYHRLIAIIVYPRDTIYLLQDNLTSLSLTGYIILCSVKMAEAVGLASGLLALASFAFQSSVTLYETVKDFHSHPKRVRDLIEELEALIGVLGPLKEMVASPAGTSLPALDLPLKRCGNACKEFEQQILKCLSRSGGDRRSFRDWARLRYMKDDIDGFRRLLAGYKLTINIALTDATL